MITFSREEVRTWMRDALKDTDLKHMRLRQRDNVYSNAGVRLLLSLAELNLGADRDELLKAAEWFGDFEYHRGPESNGGAHRAERIKASRAQITPEQWEAIKRAYSYRCAYCHRKAKGVGFKGLTKDHVIPMSKGGSNGPDNIVPACWPCNRKKHTGDAPVPAPLRLMI